MTEIDNDKLLRDFFAENKQEIADNGFSRRVMHHLPGRSNHLARIWSAFVMTVAGCRTFRMVRRIGSSLGNNKRSIYQYD
jgi:hypothetical protein